MRVSDLVPWRERRELPVRRTDDPFYAMQQEMNRLLDDFMRGLDRGVERGREMMPRATEGMAFSPSVNLAESENELEATIELPGMTEEDVDVNITRDGLVIRGEKRQERSEEDEERNYYHRECSYGYFQRTVPLPLGAVDVENVEARFENGVLTVRMPKREDVQPEKRRIPVRRGD